MSRYDRMKECPACGEQWNTHMGVSGTCKKLQIARKALEETLNELDDLYHQHSCECGHPLCLICRNSKSAKSVIEMAVKVLEETK